MILEPRKINSATVYHYLDADKLLNPHIIYTVETVIRVSTGSFDQLIIEH